MGRIRFTYAGHQSRSFEFEIILLLKFSIVAKTRNAWVWLFRTNDLILCNLSITVSPFSCLLEQNPISKSLILHIVSVRCKSWLFKKPSDRAIWPNVKTQKQKALKQIFTFLYFNIGVLFYTSNKCQMQIF